MAAKNPSSAKTALATCLALAAFAANSLLCRTALLPDRSGESLIDAGSFTAVRIVSGALVLAIIVVLRNYRTPLAERADNYGFAGSFASGMALFVYAIAFSLAYRTLAASVGALLLFGSVQATMIGYGIARGQWPKRLEWVGLAAALAGLVYLVKPGISAPPLAGAALMALAGIAWGVYSLRGRGAKDPIGATAGNFVYASPLALLAALALWNSLHVSPPGLALAIASGAITSGLGYVIWYRALPGLSATRAALVQLAVPILTALASVQLLNEPISLRLVISAALVLGGIGLSVLAKK